MGRSGSAQVRRIESVREARLGGGRVSEEEWDELREKVQ